MGVMTPNLDVVLTAFFAALGPIVGSFVGFAAHEEMKKAKKLLPTLQHVLFVTAAFVFLLAHKWQLMLVVIATTTIFAYLSTNEFKNPLLVFFLLGIGFALLVNGPYFTLYSSLVFLYGLPAGSLHKPWVLSGIFLLTSLGLYYL